MISTGSFLARAVAPLAFEKSPKKGTPCVGTVFELKAGPNLGERIEWKGWLSEKTEARTAESLSYMGYDGKDEGSVMLKDVVIVIEHEEYEKADGAKGTRPAIKWVNSADGGGHMDLMSGPEISGAKSRLAAALTAVKAKAAKQPSADEDVKF